MGRGRDGGLAAVAAATAVQAGHVDPVQVVVVLPSSVAQRLVLAVLLGPAETDPAALVTPPAPPPEGPPVLTD